MIHGSQFRTLKSVTAFIGKTSTSDLGTVVEIAWSGVSIDWDDGHSNPARVEKVSELASVGLEPKRKSVRRIGDGLVS